MGVDVRESTAAEERQAQVVVSHSAHWPSVLISEHPPRAFLAKEEGFWDTATTRAWRDITAC